MSRICTRGMRDAEGVVGLQASQRTNHELLFQCNGSVVLGLFACASL